MRPVAHSRYTTCCKLVVASDSPHAVPAAAVVVDGVSGDAAKSARPPGVELANPVSASNAAASDVCKRCRRRIRLRLASRHDSNNRRAVTRITNKRIPAHHHAADMLPAHPRNNQAVNNPTTVSIPRSVASQHVVSRQACNL
jgi:hypothetical protein